MTDGQLVHFANATNNRWVVTRVSDICVRRNLSSAKVILVQLHVAGYVEVAGNDR